MFELLTIAIFIWLLVKSIGLAFKLTWGVAKIAASILIGLAFPVLIVCFVFVGGIALLVPVVMISVDNAIRRIRRKLAQYLNKGDSRNSSPVRID